MPVRRPRHPDSFPGPRRPRTAARLALTGLALVLGLFPGRTSTAGELQLKNGMVLEGRLVLVPNLSSTDRTKAKGPIEVEPIVLVETGWQRYYVPRRQVPDVGSDLKQPDLNNRETFEFFHITKGGSLAVRQLGGIQVVSPFDEFGRRQVRLATPGKILDVTQGITKLTPKYATVKGLNYSWEAGVSTASLDPNTLDAMIRKVTKPEKAQDRLAIARFYLQAEMYPQAAQELANIAAEFPDLADRVASAQQELRRVRGQQMLRELQKRRTQGQHRLAEFVARQVTVDHVGEDVHEQIQRFLGEYAFQQEQIEKVRLQLGELQAYVTTPASRDALPRLRSIVNDELGYETLPRLEPFLRAEDDASLSADEKLALAYSGWLLGAADAVTDLPLTVRLWEARDHMLDYLRTDDETRRQELLAAMRRLDGVGPKTAVQMIPQLPPLLETMETERATTQRVEVTVPGTGRTAGYVVHLPPEYSPQRRYPLLVALHPEAMAAEQILQWWAGTPEQPGMAPRRGFIVVAPEYASPNQNEYHWDVASHQLVLECLRDARLRYAVDADRVFLAGHGMGGDAAYDLGMSHPDQFAGVIPICGAADQAHYAKFYKENIKDVPFYIVCGELDRGTLAESRPVLEFLYNRGFQYDLVLVEFLGRGMELYGDELPRLFDWMELHKRPAEPKQFEMKSLRQTDNRFHWLTALDQPPTTVLPPPKGEGSRVVPKNISGRITPGNGVHVDSVGRRCVIRLHSGLVNFEDRVTVRVNGKQRFRDFVRPDISATLEALRETGDRQRLVEAQLPL